MAAASDDDILNLTAHIVTELVGNGQARVRAEDIPQIIRDVRGALTEAATPETTPSTEGDFPKPSKRDVAKSITPDALISFIDGKPYKTLKRHLGRHGLDLAGYRERYGLPADYPFTSPSYSATRSEMAKRLGLGNSRRKQEAAPQAAPPAMDRPETATPGAKRGRKPKTQ